MIRRLAPLASIAAAAAALADGASCSYDWSVSAASADGATEASVTEAGGVDAWGEAGGDDGAPADAPAAEAALPADGDAGPIVPDAAACAQLEANVQTTRGKAITCTPAVGACSASVSDECGCTVYVGNGTSSETMAYQKAVADFLTAGCRSTIACSDTCPAAQANACAVGDAAGSYVCY
jgi:hypothetical protein